MDKVQRVEQAWKRKQHIMEQEINRLKDMLTYKDKELLKVTQILSTFEKVTLEKNSMLEQQEQKLKQFESVIAQKDEEFNQFFHNYQMEKAKVVAGSSHSAAEISKTFGDFVNNCVSELMDQIEVNTPDLTEKSFYDAYDAISSSLILNIWETISSTAGMDSAKEISTLVLEDEWKKKIFDAVSKCLFDSFAQKSGISQFSLQPSSQLVIEKAIQLSLDIQQAEPPLHFIIAKSNELFNANRYKSLDSNKIRIVSMLTPGIATTNTIENTENVYVHAIVRTK